MEHEQSQDTEIPEESYDSETDDPQFDNQADVQTAFLVIIDMQGQAQVEIDINTANSLRMMRNPSLQDLWRGCAEVAKDVQNQETAQRCVQEQVRISQQIAQQQQANKIREQIRLR